MRDRLFDFTFLLLSCLLLSTSTRSQPQKIYLNPKASGREKQTKFIDSIRFIPLEIKEGVSVSTYYNINVTEKYLLLIDYMNKVLLIYTKNGSFVKEIKYKKLGQSFYPAYDEHSNKITFFGTNKNYSLTSRDEIKIKLDWDNPRNKKYFKKYSIDLEDSLFTIRKVTPNEKDIIRAYHFYKDYYITQEINVSSLYKDSVNYEVKLYKDNKLVKTYFPFNARNEPRFLYSDEMVSFNRTDTSNIQFITRPYCDTIYKIINDSLFPAYQLVLPLENTLPSSFFTTASKNKTERENFHQNNGWMFHQVYNFQESDRFIFFFVVFLSNYDSFVYEKQTGNIYATKNIHADSTQYSLQLLKDFGPIRIGDKFYKPQKAGDLISFFDQNKNIPVPKELESFLKSKPPADTPVITEFKFKN